MWCGGAPPRETVICKYNRCLAQEKLILGRYPHTSSTASVYRLDYYEIWASLCPTFSFESIWIFHKITLKKVTMQHRSLYISAKECYIYQNSWHHYCYCLAPDFLKHGQLPQKPVMLNIFTHEVYFMIEYWYWPYAQKPCINYYLGIWNIAWDFRHF